MIRVTLPYHLRNLAQCGEEVEVEVQGTPTVGATLDALEAKYPKLKGAIRDHGSPKRRAFIRFFLCQEDWSNEPPETPLPAAVVEGTEPFMVVGALAGG